MPQLVPTDMTARRRTMQTSSSSATINSARRRKRGASSSRKFFLASLSVSAILLYVSLQATVIVERNHQDRRAVAEVGGGQNNNSNNGGSSSQEGILSRGTRKRIGKKAEKKPTGVGSTNAKDGNAKHTAVVGGGPDPFAGLHGPMDSRYFQKLQKPPQKLEYKFTGYADVSDISDVLHLAKALNFTDDASIVRSTLRGTPATAESVVPENYLDISAAFQDDYPIRSFGCDRNETPFVFVHIGKAGGGTVRRRISASALNFTGSNWKLPVGAYYPIGKLPGDVYSEKDEQLYVASDHVRGSFCTSRSMQFWPDETMDAFEGTLPCTATTPLGQAAACPHTDKWACCDPDADLCPSVYAGHNVLGSEMHWLPRGYLIKWLRSVKDGTAYRMNEDPAASLPDDVYRLFQGSFLRANTESWCAARASVTRKRKMREGTLARNFFNNCSAPIADAADAAAKRATALLGDRDHDWSPLYASLPVLRVTIVRDPFSWLMSKFFWHHIDKVANCSDVEFATHGAGRMPRNVTDMVAHASDEAIGNTYKEHVAKYGKKEVDDDSGRSRLRGWAHTLALHYIVYLCGEDCGARLQLDPDVTLVDLLRQADRNLRQSFAVVGLLNETETFYDMLSARVHYADLTRNAHMDGGRHPSQKTDEQRRCKKEYAQPAFQKRLLEASPELAGLQRLYETAIQVNRAQVAELRTCPGSKWKET